MENKFFGLKTAIEETEKFYKEQLSSIDTFKIHQGRMLTSISLIITTFGFLLSRIESKLDVIPSFVIAVGALFLVYLCIYSFLVMPISLDTPIEINKDVLKKAFAKPEEKNILENKLENYINVIHKNSLKINKLVIWSKISILIFFAIIIIVFINFCIIVM